MSTTDLIKPPAGPEGFIRPFGDPVLDGYLRDVATWHGSIRFVGLPVLKDTGRLIPLPRLFVEPRLSPVPLSPEQLNDDVVENQTSSLVEAIVEHQRLVLLGDPGSGKSTIISWICDNFATFGGSDLSNRLGQLVPIPLVLRELALTDSVDWNSLVGAFLDRPVAEKLSKAPERVTQLMKAGQAIILIDGLDEVSASSREAVRAAVWEGWCLYPKCRWLMTSRIIGYERYAFDRAPSLENTASLKVEETAPIAESAVTGLPDWLPFLQSSSNRLCPRLYVVPFTVAQIREFSMNWHRLRAANEREADQNAADLLRAVLADPGTKTLARVPNLLTLMALIHRQHATLPNGRALLFSKITEAYLESIDEARKLRPVVESSRAEKERWLGDVAFQMQMRRDVESSASKPGEAPGEIRVPQYWLLEELASLLVTRKKVTQEKAHAEATILLDIIAERSGLLLPRGPSEEGEMWAFAHLSFQEYFAAQRLRRAVRSPGWRESRGDASPEKLLAYAGRPIWRETFILLFESLASEETEEISWPDHLAESLFWRMEDVTAPLLATEVVYEVGGLARLATPLVHDPHSGLDLETRTTLFRKLWNQYFAGYKYAENGNILRFGDIGLLPDLFKTSEYSDLCADAFLYVANEVKPRGLVVFDLERQALDVVLSLKWLQILYLIQSLSSDSLQTDIDAVSSMGDLRVLSIEVHGEANLKPLGRLSRLEDLHIRGHPDASSLKEVLNDLRSGLITLSLPDVDNDSVTLVAQSLGKLRKLSLTGPTNEQLSLLKGSRISSVTLSRVGFATDLLPLVQMPQLVDLTLYPAGSGDEPNLTPLIGRKGLVVNLAHHKVWNAESEPIPSKPWSPELS